MEYLEVNSIIEFGSDSNANESTVKNNRVWQAARTDVFIVIEEEIAFCQAQSKAKIFVDDCEIGKTFSAKHLSRTRKNCFYIDGSQATTKILFTKLLAQTIGLECFGRYAEIKADIKRFLRTLKNPIVIIDDGGYLKDEVFVDLNEYWNSTEGYCGWYMIGDDSLKNKIEKSIRSKKPGFRAFLSRWSSKFSRITPVGEKEKILFYRKLITDVLSVNLSDANKISDLVTRCITKDENGNIGGLRRAESLMILCNY